MAVISLIPIIIIGIFIIAAIALFAGTKKDKQPEKSTSYDSNSVYWASTDHDTKKSSDNTPNDYSGDIGGGDGGGGGGD